MKLVAGTFRCLHSPICIVLVFCACSVIYQSLLVDSSPILEEDQQATRKPRAAILHGTKLWPDGIVHFVIDQSLVAHREVIFEAFNDFHQNTCIQFKKCRQNRCDHYLKLIKYQNICASDVGINKTITPQNVTLGDGCWNLGTIVHELTHAVGLMHEHQRPDRDDYVTVHWEFIDKNKTDQFDLRKDTTTLTPFDLHSVNIYDQNAFPKNGTSNNTITPKDPNVTLPHSSLKSGLSELDIVGLNKLYNCTTLDTNRQ